MNKNLHDNTDNLFLFHLDSYSENPPKDVWTAIDKRLSEKEKKERNHIKLNIVSIACAVVFCLLIPFWLTDSFLYHGTFTSNPLTNQYTMNSSLKKEHELTEESAIKTNSTKSENLLAIQKEYPPLNKLSLAVTSTDLQVLQMPNADHKQPANPLPVFNFFKDSLATPAKGSVNTNTSIIIKLSKNNLFTLKPFFSFDHIAGRFIEQYEFDHASKSDYSQREKPDISYTAGVLGTYQLGKKISIMSGISGSSSMVSISSTAVNALKDASGVYKFKLATSYGFAEISNSGVMPRAGDSLVVSGAVMQFNYISFPLLMDYKISNKKIKLSAHGGLALNKMVSEKVEAEYNVQNNAETEKISKIEGIRKTFFTVNAGVEASYGISHSVEIGLSPELRYGINSINKNTPIKTYPVNYGLAFHVNIKL